jgi:hypothetical protein
VSSFLSLPKMSFSFSTEKAKMKVLIIPSVRLILLFFFFVVLRFELRALHCYAGALPLVPCLQPFWLWLFFMYLFIFLAVLGLELGVSCLLGRCSYYLSHTPQPNFVYFWDRVLLYAW